MKHARYETVCALDSALMRCTTDEETKAIEALLTLVMAGHDNLAYEYMTYLDDKLQKAIPEHVWEFLH